MPASRAFAGLVSGRFVSITRARIRSRAAAIRIRAFPAGNTRSAPAAANARIVSPMPATSCAAPSASAITRGRIITA